MSAWLGRPNLIDQKTLILKFPTLRLDQSATEPNLLSPFAHMALQAHLGRRVSTIVGDVQAMNDLTVTQILDIESECEKFIEELPAIFRVENPDISLDEEHPYFVFQRYQLHCVIFITMLDFLKPYLTRDRRDKMTNKDDEFRKMGVDIALRVILVAGKLFDREFPIHSKFHMVVFGIFDTATVLCSAIIHDRDNVLPRRQEIVEAIESSLDMLLQLSSITKLGASSYQFLLNLVQATPELSQNAPTRKRQRQMHLPAREFSALELCHQAPNSALVDATTHFTSPAADTLPSTTAHEDTFDLDHFLANNPFGDLSNTAALDIGGIEQIWDWDGLNIDVFPQNGALT